MFGLDKPSVLKGHALLRANTNTHHLGGSGVIEIPLSLETVMLVVVSTCRHARQPLSAGHNQKPEM